MRLCRSSWDSNVWTVTHVLQDLFDLHKKSDSYCKSDYFLPWFRLMKAEPWNDKTLCSAVGRQSFFPPITFPSNLFSSFIDMRRVTARPPTRFNPTRHLRLSVISAVRRTSTCTSGGSEHELYWEEDKADQVLPDIKLSYPFVPSQMMPDNRHNPHGTL